MGDKYDDPLDIWQIIVITLACCGGLVVMVMVFWGISQPTDSDRIVHYLSMKREKKQRRKSSQGAGQALTSSLGHSLDRSLRTNSVQPPKNYDIVSDQVEMNQNVVEESVNNDGGGGGSTQPFNYQRLKEDDEQTS